MPDSHPRLTRSDAAPNVGIVHFGPGAFFRAFNAVYTQDVLDAVGGDWGIVAVSLRSSTFRDQLKPQEGVFTSVTLEPTGPTHRTISSIADVLVAPEAPSAVLDAMVQDTTKIVSLTITEKGYCHEPSTGNLRLDHEDIVHDLAHPQTPKSAPGYIVEALAQRKAAGSRPFTVLSCDNIPSNGKLAREIILSLARARDAALARWIEAEVRFPSTMVDRITPATTEADTEKLASDQGYFDPANVQHEPFRQWVIEDDFVDGARPDWSIGGAQFVADVDAHELMKLRCLNGTHSSLAYLGYLAGFETIAQTVANPAFAQFCEAIWANEIVPTVPKPEGEDLGAYCAALLERYRNPAIRHRTWQIAMDGSQKLPQRLLGTLADNLAAGRSVSRLALAVAGWMRYVGGVDEKGAPIDVKDPLAQMLREAVDQADTPAGKVAALLAIRDVFDADLATNPIVVAEVTQAYESLVAKGALAAVMEISV